MSTIRLISGSDEFIADWTAARLGGMGIESGRDISPCTCIGIMAGERLIAGVVYHSYNPRTRNIQMSMAADNPRWCVKGVIKSLLHYPFSIGCYRVNVVCRLDNDRMERLLRFLGFVREGTHVHFFGDAHAISWRLLRPEYHRLLVKIGREDGQQQQGRIAKSS